MKSDELYFLHILDAIDKIDRFTADFSYEMFCENEVVVSAVLRELVVIGEAANQMSDDARRQMASIPWSETIGMRNKIIHEYFGVDLDVAWETIRTDLAVLRKSIEASIDEEELKKKYQS